MKTQLIIHSIVSGFANLHWMQELKVTSPFKQKEKKQLNNMIKTLSNYEGLYDELFPEESEEGAARCLESFLAFQKEMADVRLDEMPLIVEMKRAARKDEKSMRGITNKIIR